jgi:hypothetical protein
MLTAEIKVGQSYSWLHILDEDRRHVASLNLIWGHGGGDTPEDRADTLLDQNGYRRTTEWADGTAQIEIVGPVGRCSCWRSGTTILVDHNCRDHGTPTLR